MQRRKLCEHPSQHSNSLGALKVQRSVSLRLAEFMDDRYDLDDFNFGGLCGKNHAFGSKQMEEDEAIDIQENISSNDDKQEHDDEEKDQDESSSDDSLYELTYQQQEAMRTLSDIF